MSRRYVSSVLRRASTVRCARLLLLMWIGAQAAAQSVPPGPGAPVSLTEPLVQARLQLLATVPVNSLEGVDVAADGALYVTNASDHAVLSIGSSGDVGRIAELGAVPQVVRISGQYLLLTAQEREPDFAALAREHRGPAAAEMGALGALVVVLDERGNRRREVRGPKGSFFNGMDLLGDNMLVADSTAATIWRVDLERGRVDRWLRDPLLAPFAGRFPGANGLRIRNGYVYVANTTGNAIYRIRVTAQGVPAGRLSRVATVVSPDDFDVAVDGTLYVPSEDRVLEIPPHGVARVIAEGCHGCDAARLSDAGRTLLLVTHGFGADAGAGHVYRLALPGGAKAQPPARD